MKISPILLFTGEFSRVYKPDHLAAVLSRYTTISTLIMIIAPVSSPIFYGVNIQIGWWKLTQYNFVALLLAIAALITTIVSYFKMSNLTIEPAYKLVKSEFVIKEDKQQTPIKLWTLKDIISDFELMIILVVECFIAYQGQLQILTSIIAVSKFRLSIFCLAVTFALAAFILSIFLYVIEKTLLGDVRNIYYLYVLSFISTMFSCNLLTFNLFVDLKGKVLQSLIVCIMLLFNYFPYFASTAYCRSLIFFITPSHSASIVESYRLTVQQLFSSIGFFSASYAFDYLAIVSINYCLIAFLIVMVLLLFLRQNYFTRLIRGRNEVPKGD